MTADPARPTPASTDSVARDATAQGDLIACPKCDALYRVPVLAKGETARCDRCHAILIAPRAKAGMTIIMLALTLVVLVGGAVGFPFLTIHRQGFGNEASLIDAARAFDSGWMAVLALSVLAFIVLIPLARATLILYVLGPLVFDRPAARHAAAAFRLSETLRPWSMAEIFALGCAVSLVKITDLATVGFGPAFWMFGAVVLVSILLDARLCRWSVWEAIAGPPGARSRAADPDAASDGASDAGATRA